MLNKSRFLSQGCAGIIALAACAVFFASCGDPTRLPTFTVSFHANGGAGTISPQEVNAGSSITLSGGAGFSKDGHVFAGWNTMRCGNGTHLSANAAFTPVEDVTLFAMWTFMETFTVSFNANGGTGTISPQMVNSGSSITLPAGGALSNPGYNFGGWNTVRYGDGVHFSANAPFSPVGNITLYAMWNPVGYVTVRFNANGGVGSVPEQRTTQGGEITLPGGTGISRDGFSFGGWNTNAAGTGRNYNAGATFTLTTDTILYARWVDALTVSFNSNLGTGQVPAQTVGRGLYITIPAGHMLSKSGHVFSGWNENIDGTGARHSVGTLFSPPRSMTLYATWMPVGVSQLAVSFDANGGGGSPPVPMLVVAGFGMNLPGSEGLSRAGYAFLGWNTNAEGTGVSFGAGAHFTPLSNTVLYARWAPVDYGPFVPVTGITGVPNSATVGIPLPLAGTVTPPNATNQAIVWGIQNAGATGATIVDGNMLNTAAEGTVTVRAIVANGLAVGIHHTQYFSITVTDLFVPVTGITGVQTSALVGTPLPLTGTVEPANATGRAIAWSVQNAGATGATITGNTLNTMAAGTVTVRATIANGLAVGTDFTQDFDILVTALFVPVTGITMPAWLDSVTVGTPLHLAGSVTPWNATNWIIVWSVQGAGTTGATITGNTLNTTAEGTVTVRATIADGVALGMPFTRDFEITSIYPVSVTGVTVSPQSVSVDRGVPRQFTAMVTGISNPPQGVTWSIIETTADGRHSQTTINQFNGTLTVAVAETLPTLTVRATSTFDNTVYGTAIVTVNFPGGTGAGTREDPIVVSGLNLAEQLAWLRASSQSGNYYLVEVSANATLSAANLALPTGRTNLTVTLRGIGVARVINRPNMGAIFTIGSGLTLVLDENITLGPHASGQGWNNSRLVLVNNGGTLVMNDGSRIVNNRGVAIGNVGGGVLVNSGGMFVMHGGAISGNQVESGGGGGGVRVQGGIFTMYYGTIVGNNSPAGGGGVHVSGGGIFAMHGGTISNNASSQGHGGGVHIDNDSTFAMYGGTISSNTSGGNFGSGSGGGVFVGLRSTFTMQAGTISDNTAIIHGTVPAGTGWGGGVSLAGNNSTFAMYEGTISGNSAETAGGVNVAGGGVFTMHGGTIYDNTSDTNGGGVLANGTFTMLGGAISGNHAGNIGGGVRVPAGTFRISNGIIHGNDAGAGLANTAANGEVSLSLGANGTAERGMFSNGTFFAQRNLTTTDLTIEVRPITITVTGILPEYHGKWVFLALLAPGMGDWLAWADIYSASSFTTFSLQFAPGDYDVNLLFIEGEVSYMYTLPNWTFNAGNNVIPFSSFQPAPAATSFPDNLELLRRSGRAP